MFFPAKVPPHMKLRGGVEFLEEIPRIMSGKLFLYVRLLVCLKGVAICIPSFVLQQSCLPPHMKLRGVVNFLA